jgi:hypothetical protein
MAKPEHMMQDAEAFVRQVAARFPDAGADEKTIKAAAVKICRSFEGIRRQEKAA